MNRTISWWLIAWPSTGDVSLHNNLNQEHWKAFYPRRIDGRIKDKDFWLQIVRGRLRQASEEYWAQRAYSTCPLSMPVLIAPIYRLGYIWNQRVRYCVALFFHCLAAAVVVLVARLIFRLTGSVWRALGMAEIS